MRPTVPELDFECDRLSREEATEFVRETQLEGEDGLHLRFFQSGHGEWSMYYTASSDEGKVKRWSGDCASGVQSFPLGHLLGQVRPLPYGQSTLRDINRVPKDRLPEWGDGSAHYRCEECRRPIIKSERVLGSDMKYYHSACDRPE